MALEQLGLMTPPGNIAGQLAPQKTPVINDRSFSIEPNDDFQTIRIKGREYFVTPVDAETNRPYPILQHETLRVDDPMCANLHHAVHPGHLYSVSESLFPDDPSPLAREAERNAVLQYVNPLDHNVVDPKKANTTYHDWFFGTMPLKTEREIFAYVIPAISGILPQYALDVRGYEPKIVKPTPAQVALMMSVRKPKPITPKKLAWVRGKAIIAHGKLYSPAMDEETYAEERVQAYRDRNNAYHGFPHQYFTYRTDIIRDFIADYVFKQDINVSEDKIEEFLTEADVNKKRFLGDKLLKMAVDAAALDIDPTYQSARKKGRLHEARPRSARGVVWNILGQSRQRGFIAQKYDASLRTREQYADAA